MKNYSKCAHIILVAVLSLRSPLIPHLTMVLYIAKKAFCYTKDSFKKYRNNKELHLVSDG